MPINLFDCFLLTFYVCFLGENGHYYCGMRVLSCLCCDGICGPQHGCNCTPCQKLDDEETARTAAMVERAISARRIMDSWLWAPQPCKYIFISCILRKKNLIHILF